MKKIAITVAVVFLTCQLSYASYPCGNILKNNDEPQELTPEKAQEIFIAILASIDWESLEYANGEEVAWEDFGQGGPVISEMTTCDYLLYAMVLMISGGLPQFALVFLMLYLLSCI